MADELSSQEKKLRLLQYETCFFVMAKIGAVMIIMVTLVPMYAANHIPAAIIFFLAIYYKIKFGLPKRRKLSIAFIIIVCAMFIGLNTIFQWFPVPAAGAAKGFLPVLTNEKITLTLSNIGQFIVFIGAFQVLIGSKYME